MSLHPILPDGWPAPRGPYSPGLLAGGLVFVSGQLPVNPRTGTMVEGDVRAQTAQVLANVEAVLQAAGGSIRHIVKTTVYLLSRADWAAMNEVYAQVVGPALPSRCAVIVAEMAPGALVEIEAIALLGAEGDGP